MSALLPAMRRSLQWHRRETIRALRAQAADARTPRMRTYLLERAGKVRALPLRDLRASYLALRTSEIRRAPLAECADAVRRLERTFVIL